MTRAFIAALLAAALVLAGCNVGPDTKCDLECVQALRAENTQLHRQLLDDTAVRLAEIEDARAARQSAAEWAFVCGWRMPVCPQDLIAEGKRELAARGVRMGLGIIWKYAAELAVLALPVSLGLILLWLSGRIPCVRRLERRADVANGTLARAAAADARIAAEKARMEQVTEQCREKEGELVRINDRCAQALQKSEALRSEIDELDAISVQRKAMLDALSDWSG